MRAAALVAAFALGLVAAPALAQDLKTQCIAASEQAQKLVDQRRLLEARDGFLSCAKDACPEAVRSDCQKQYDDVKRSIPSVIVRVTGKDGSDVAEGAVSLDGAKIGVLDGKELEMNPGTHEIAVALPDGTAFHRQVILAPGEHARVIAFDARTPVAAQPAGPPAAQAAAGKPAMRWTTVRSIGFVSTMVGAVALTGGVLTELLALVSQSDATTLQGRSAYCPNLSVAPNDSPSNYDTNCQSAIGYHSQALTEQSIAYGLLIGGGVALVGGLVLFAVGGSRPVAAHAASVQLTPLVGPGFGGLGAVGVF